MSKASQIRIVYRPVSALVPYVRNSRTHSDEQVGQIIESIRQFGWTNPLIIDGANGLIAGEGRLKAAIRMGLEEVPCIEKGDMSELQRRAYVIADNKLALNAGWNTELLQLELGELADEGFDLGLTGFNDEELMNLMGTEGEESGVSSVPTSAVADRFWISIRGPLALQADALQRLRTVMDDLPIDVELGTVNRDSELEP